MKLVINVPDYIKEQADNGKGEEFGIPLWLAYEIANGTPLPKGHGRLIDADSFQKYCFNKNFDKRLSEEGLAIINMFLEFQPTIIESDKAESEDKAIEQESCTNIPFLLHKEFGCPLDECAKAYEKANEYLRSKSKLKG